MSQHACPQCGFTGSGFWADAGKVLSGPVKFALRSGLVPGGGIAATAMDLAGLGVGGRMKRIKRTRRVSESSRLRADIVRSVMRDRGVDMPTASSIVKQENLWQK